jgi:hypothetical protein
MTFWPGAHRTELPRCERDLAPTQEAHVDRVLRAREHLGDVVLAILRLREDQLTHRGRGHRQLQALAQRLLDRATREPDLGCRLDQARHIGRELVAVVRRLLNLLGALQHVAHLFVGQTHSSSGHISG